MTSTRCLGRGHLVAVSQYNRVAAVSPGPLGLGEGQLATGALALATEQSSEDVEQAFLRGFQ